MKKQKLIISEGQSRELCLVSFIKEVNRYLGKGWVVIPGTLDERIAADEWVGLKRYAFFVFLESPEEAE